MHNNKLEDDEIVKEILQNIPSFWVSLFWLSIIFQFFHAIFFDSSLFRSFLIYSSYALSFMVSISVASLVLLLWLGFISNFISHFFTKALNELFSTIASVFGVVYVVSFGSAIDDTEVCGEAYILWITSLAYTLFIDLIVQDAYLGSFHNIYYTYLYIQALLFPLSLFLLGCIEAVFAFFDIHFDY